MVGKTVVPEVLATGTVGASIALEEIVGSGVVGGTGDTPTSSPTVGIEVVSEVLVTGTVGASFTLGESVGFGVADGTGDRAIEGKPDVGGSLVGFSDVLGRKVGDKVGSRCGPVEMDGDSEGFILSEGE